MSPCRVLFILCDLIGILSLSSGIFISSLILIVIFRKLARHHAISNLLLANTCICTLELCISDLVIYAVILANDLTSNPPLTNIYDQQVLCPLRSYFLFTGFSLLYTSYCLQAYYRLRQVIFYKKQYSCITFVYWCLVQWTFSFLLISPMLFTGAFVYIPADFFCPIPFTKPLSVAYIAISVYGIFIAIFVVIYSWIYVYARQTTSTTIKRRRTIDRHFTMLKRMALPTFALMFLGVVYLTLFFQTLVNQYRTHFLTYRLSYLFIAVGMSFIHVITISQTPPIRRAVLEIFYCFKEKMKKATDRPVSMADNTNTTNQPPPVEGEQMQLLTRVELKADHQEVHVVICPM